MRRPSGFTLVELLIVIAIIGILTSIVIGSTNASRGKARDTRRIADMKEIQLALAVYYDVNKVYPASLSTLAATGQKYMAAIPTDPQTKASYEYLTSNSNRNYCIGVKLEGAIPSDHVNCTSQSSGSTANYKAQR